MSREAELRDGLERVHARIAAAAGAAGRDADDITLVVVTKFFPAEEVRLLHGLGVRDVGENRHQEAQAKAAELRDLEPPLRWHYIGGLQSNKAAAVASYADVVHSVDRSKLVTGLSRGAVERGRPLAVLVQVDLDPDGAPGSGRAGAAPDDVPVLADAVVAADGLDLRGVMAVAPLGVDPAPAFERLSEVASGVREEHPSATWVSAGMSGDLEAAIASGATHVRVGSAVLGARPSRG
ncbi:YggS family pyridoxal phosphate enzyme [Marmoricola endophyticus]|uniref:Pyridoxal phosphate homeostasis protein n=1 Tax=Marmoricola endophyticus TaxID=2040280 RepID=A0A917F0B9_9ACTN|nr:YggS family pyridoxal phosphate-dependent enzyme [Marmoricola endophyticus]GGF37906.1 YggS family pyridoxal phosphate enzyme [Marmoricola endophyticus]